jgi:RHS repeat-associated protein
MQITSQVLRNVSFGAGASHIATFSGGPYTDVTVSAQVQTSGSSGSQGTVSVGVRLGNYSAGSATSGYIAELDTSGVVRLWRVDTFTELGSYAIPGYTAGQWITLTLQAVTDNLSVQVNGTAAITATDSLFLIGDVGLWSYEPASAGQHGFENFSVVPQGGVSAATINYTYDPLYRLTNANYSTGTVFTYTYDAVGNRLSQTITSTTVYTYDDANRLTNAGGVAYTWDNNGNLLNDGVFTYTYDTANRLSAVNGGGVTASYAYDGIGARMRQVTGGITTTYTLDLNAGLVQVLADSGANTYLYGNGRIAQFAGTNAQYFLADHLGSVRQLTSASGAVTLAKSYQPYGSVLSSAGTVGSSYGFTGELSDSYIKLTYLRARYYASDSGRFITKDMWPKDHMRPVAFNLWLYAHSNPVNLTDPTGEYPWGNACRARQYKGDGPRYCILNNGGFIDTVHFEGARNTGNPNTVGGISYSVFTFRQSGEPAHVLTIKQTVGYVVPIYGTYTLHHLDELNDNQLKRLALTIYMDYQQNVFEPFQLLSGSAFSNEDLPSDYLGFVAGMDGYDLEWAVQQLGGGYASYGAPPGYEATLWQAVLCARLGVCDDRNPYNNAWTLKIRYDCGNGDIRYINKPWPSALHREPIEEGRYWLGPWRE